MESNKPIKQRLIGNQTKENRLKILKAISEKPLTLNQINDYFDYISKDKEVRDTRGKLDYINQNVLRLKDDYQIIEIKPTEQNKMILREFFKLNWNLSHKDAKKPKSNRSPRYYLASVSSHNFFKFYNNFNNKFKREIKDEKELDKKFKEVMEFLNIFELLRYNAYQATKKDKILTTRDLIRNFKFFLGKNNEKEITYVSDFIKGLLKDRFMQIAIYRNMKFDGYQKTRNIRLFDKDMSSPSKVFLEKIYLWFIEMERTTTKENIFGALNKSNS